MAYLKIMPLIFHTKKVVFGKFQVPLWCTWTSQCNPQSNVERKLAFNIVLERLMGKKH